jgi:glycosyltransferase involved in cell wall biosynthesis
MICNSNIMQKSNMKIALSHPAGNPNVKGVLSGLRANGMLHSFHTSITCFPDSWVDKFAGFSLLKDFKRRSFDSNIQQQTNTYPYKELGRLLSQRLHFSSLLRHETGMFSTYKCCQHIDNKVADYILTRNDISGIYAYEDCAFVQFNRAKERRIKCFYDLPIGYWRAKNRMLSEEIEKNPDWIMTLGGFNDSQEKLQCKDKELMLADTIFVASSFTKKTLEEYPDDLVPVKVIPYGFPPINTARTYSPIHQRKIKLLYIGGLTQRKGIAYLFDAVKGLKDKVELTVVGKGNIEGCPALKRELEKHKYIPSLPHSEILKLMASQDVFVFPSLFEGFGLVITEAMSQGVPVITTERTCAPDIITHGQDGWIVEAGSVIALREQLENIIALPEILKTVGQEALLTAQKRTWSKYGQETVHAIMD